MCVSGKMTKGLFKLCLSKLSCDKSAQIGFSINSVCLCCMPEFAVHLVGLKHVVV